MSQVNLLLSSCLNFVAQLNLKLKVAYFSVNIHLGFGQVQPELYLQDLREINFLFCFIHTDCSGESIS